MRLNTSYICLQVTGRQPDIEALDQRIDHLMSTASATPYNKRKEALEQEFRVFLQSLYIIQKPLPMAVPRDVCRFLAWKDRKGKTPVHSVGCPSLGSRRVCDCPKRLAVGTVENVVGRLRAVFHREGLGKTFDEGLKQGNLAASLAVARYVNAIKMEQSVSHACPKQAVPVFADKLELIASYIERQLEGQTSLSLRQRFVLLRDQALLKFAFFSGDRAGDIGRMLTQELKILPGDRGFLVRHTWGKTFRMDRANVFSIHRCENTLICPVKGIQTYVQGAQGLSIDLRCGYLFRPVGSEGRVLDEGLSYASIYDRLKVYLKVLGIDAGETPHGLRAGCAITMACAEGVSGGSDIMQHVGWSTKGSMEHYTRMGRIADGTSVAESLAKSVVADQQAPAQVYSGILDNLAMPPAFPVAEITGNKVLS